MQRGGSRPAPGKRDLFIQEVIKTAGIGECSQLCDVAEMEHVCELVREAFHAAAQGVSYGLSAGMRQHLIQPLERYLCTLAVPPGKRGHRLELQPTLELIAAAEEVMQRIDQGPWSELDAEETLHLLRYAWCAWIAHVASFYMWSEVPKLLASKQLATVNGSKGGRPASLDAAAILKTYDRLAETMPVRNVAAKVASIHSCSSAQVRKLVREREQAEEEKRNEPPG